MISVQPRWSWWVWGVMIYHGLGFDCISTTLDEPLSNLVGATNMPPPDPPWGGYGINRWGWKKLIFD